MPTRGKKIREDRKGGKHRRGGRATRTDGPLNWFIIGRGKSFGWKAGHISWRAGQGSNIKQSTALEKKKKRWET